MRNLFWGWALLWVGMVSSSWASFKNDYQFDEIIDKNYQYFYEGYIPVRTYDGSHNNERYPDWGKAKTPLLRLTQPLYEKGVDKDGKVRKDLPRLSSEPLSLLNARRVSNGVLSENVEGASIPEKNISDLFWVFGQFLDHDITLVEKSKKPVQIKYQWYEHTEIFPIQIPKGDLKFDPYETGKQSIELTRSNFSDEYGYREQVNSISAFIDGSNVYGSDDHRAAWLWEPTTGYMKEDATNLLPKNTGDLANEPDNRRVPKDFFFVAGDVRANEQILLTAMHTIFMREHNWIVRQIQESLAKRKLPLLPPKRVYDIARMLVGAELQLITYRDWLPILLGRNALGDYKGYRKDIDPSIRNFFATAAFRFGHSMVPQNLLLVGDPKLCYGKYECHLPVRKAFFELVPMLMHAGAIEPGILGASQQQAQRLDLVVVDELRNFLFGNPSPKAAENTRPSKTRGLDLAALNIQRGRDHGIATYNLARLAYTGLNQERLSEGVFNDSSFLYKMPALKSLEEVNGYDPEVYERLSSVYDHPDQIDPWVGGLAEERVEGALVGRLFHSAISEQFERLRAGDSYWYERRVPKFLLDWVYRQSLGSIIRRNTRLHSIPDNPFRIYSSHGPVAHGAHGVQSFGTRPVHSTGTVIPK